MRVKRIFKSILSFINKNGKFKSLYWFSVLLLTSWAVKTIFVLTFKRYVSDSVSIGIETTYLHWINTFPAVTLCLSKNRSSSQVLEYIKRRNLTHYVSKNNYAKNLHDYIFVNSNNMVIKEEYCLKLNSTCGVDIFEMRKQLLPRTCESIIERIVFLNQTYTNCSSFFKFHELQMGYCFLANNLYDYADSKNLPLKFSMTDEVYISSPEDLPYFNSQSYDMNTDPTVYRFNVEDVYNNKDLADETVQQRTCKFPFEKAEDSILDYSFSSCMTDVRIHLELEHCNCTLCTYPDRTPENYCDVKGIQCLIQADIASKTKDYITNKLACYPSCIEQQQSLIGSNEVDDKDLNGLLFIQIEITNIPSVRYQRETTQTKLDLIVSAGGIIGLFAGASLLNIIELLTYCLVLNKKLFLILKN